MLRPPAAGRRNVAKRNRNMNAMQRSRRVASMHLLSAIYSATKKKTKGKTLL